MLYLLHHSPASLVSLQDLLKSKDVLVLLQEGVYEGILQSPLPFLEKGVLCYALEVDVHARGLREQIHPQVLLISYEELVDLTLQHHPILSWFS